MRCFSFLLIMTFFYFGSIEAQNAIDSLKTDTIKLKQHIVVIKYPSNYYKNETTIDNGDYGGKSVSFASKPPISIIVVMEAPNSKIDFGENSVITDEKELDYCYMEKGFCPFKGFFRCDTYKNSCIKIAYENVSECEKQLFDSILDDVIIKIKE